MSEKHLQPAKGVVSKMGGARACAEVTGKHISRVYGWMYPKSRGGAGGVIPSADAAKLLAAAKARRIDLTPDDFFPAASEEEVA